MYKDYYSILELTYTATQAEIKKNYRKLAKKWHPDINKRHDATPKMQEITEAYLILSDPDARLRYDIIH
jgi:curved DNA-binding protein CbpA